MISTDLLNWHRQLNKRDLPWKGLTDAYKIWVSEIILQQTRVEQGLKYYEKFIYKYPTVHHLANAKEEDVMRLWQGLGYYSRCRNMLTTAQTVVNDFDGVFPKNYSDIRSLKGIGDYTAAAIASFAYKLPYAVVDGNVVRILSRLYELEIDFKTSAGKKHYQRLAQSLISRSKPHLYNQAIMDLGATICKPAQPLCSNCPLAKYCGAYRNKTISSYPVKSIKNPLRVRHFHYLFIEKGNWIWIRKRQSGDIWEGLHDFYLVETNSKNLSQPLLSQQGTKLMTPAYMTTLEQKLSHQHIYAHFYKTQHTKHLKPNNMLFRIERNSLSEFAFPRIIISFFEKFGYL